jgi:hypothetical protein
MHSGFMHRTQRSGSFKQASAGSTAAWGGRGLVFASLGAPVARVVTALIYQTLGAEDTECRKGEKRITAEIQVDTSR